ncbi:hypothetical protein CFC21_071546 [Triticum aestivum]|uniref:Major facilitator superfamily (MFS) profile domain-containing protein n=2 Tax=Triticum aestivum TaxID=4565 RepID=A0A9R1HIQ8_WHEAT|nr:hypothetical protein CFC21_071546 [Triticum aestivum]
MNGPIEDIARELGFQGNPFLQGLVVSIFIVGAFFGSLGSSALVDYLGCKRTLQIDSIPLIVGAFISAQAHSLDEMLLGRFLVGIGIGVNTVLVPIYISEVAPTKYRGTLGTLCQIGTCLGIIASLSLGIPSESDPHWWRTMLYAACVPGFFIVVGMQFAVESPRWLAKVGRLDDARKVVENIWGVSEAEKAMEEMKSVVANDDSQASWSELLAEPHNRGALVASNLMDKQGRKNLLIGSYLGMAFAMFLIVFSISFPLDEGVGHTLSVTGTLLYALLPSFSLAYSSLHGPQQFKMYIFTFALGAGPVTGIIIPELSSARTRSKVMGFSFTVHWICNFVVGLYFLELVKLFGVGAVYAGFGGVSLLSALFAYNFIVETKGRSLEEIELSLSPAAPGERK